MKNERPVHFLTKRPGNELRVCACGKVPQRYTIDPAKASCHDCARKAEELTPHQRDVIWWNANDRMRTTKKSPWQDVLEALERGAK
jgi:hypothetical protein